MQKLHSEQGAGKTDTGRFGLRILVKAVAVAVLLAGFPSIGPAETQEPPPGLQAGLTDLSLEELMNVEIVTVSKSPEKWFDAPAAVYVITQEDIRRSGVTSIPEALRLAPGVQVARIDSNKWAIGIRGFTSRLSRSLLVLIDGRSVYTPLFAGVYWEVQDLLLEDIERIEVIRGPGGTLWGANAVNGVINIITRRAKETQGGMVSLGGGTEERAFGGFRYGGAVGGTGHYRVYGKFFSRDGGYHEEGPEFDRWKMGQGGFRTDLNLSEGNAVTVQGDFYSGKSGQMLTVSRYATPFLETVEEDADLSGGNILVRWDRVQSERSDWSLKFYYDRTSRKEPNFEEDLDTVDLDFQHRWHISPGQEVTWGVGYRYTLSDTDSIPTIVFKPARRADNLYSAFIQYKRAFLDDRLDLTLGSKFEHNDYSGFEAQPSARLLWKPSPRQSVWAAVSRAVRTPSRVEHGFEASNAGDPGLPVFLRLIGDEKRFDSEEVLAYEFGYRVQPADRLSFGVAAFYNRYDNLLSAELGTPFLESFPPDPDRLIIPAFFENNMNAKTYGIELEAGWTPSDRWRLIAVYSFLKLNLEPDSDSLDGATEESVEGASPRHMVTLRSITDLSWNLELDGTLRYVGRLESQDIKGYYGLDVRLGWLPSQNLEFSVVGQNLIKSRHAEFIGDAGAFQSRMTEVERGVYGKVDYRW